MTEQARALTTRVIVADDHPIVRSGIITQLVSHTDIKVLGEAANGNDAFDLVSSLQPDVLILDVNMPGLPAVDLLRQVQSLPSPPRVLVLTAHSDMEYVLALLKAGAKGYLLKDEDPAAITTAVRTVAEGKTWISPAIMESLVSYSVRDTVKTQEHDLTPREIEVLRLLAKGLDNQEIGDVLHVTERAVRYHLRNIYDKLGVQRRSAAIAWAVRQRLDEA